MESAKQRKATFISKKLQFLKDQGDDLINVIGQYVNKITVAGSSWTQGGDNNMEFQDLYQMIESASLFLCEKCQELADLSSQSITAAASTPATSYRQPAAPLASTATTSYRQSTESVQPADDAQLKPVLAKIAVIEEALYSFRNRTEKVAEQQCGIDEQLTELLSKLSESDKKHSSRFKQVKQQISDISEAQDAIEQGQNTRLHSLEKQLQKISTAQNRQKAEMESQAELVETLVHVPNLLESVKESVDALDARIDRIIDDCSTKHEAIETVTRDLANTVLSEGQDKMSTLMNKLETRLQTMEADGGINVKDVQKQAEKGEANITVAGDSWTQGEDSKIEFQELCQMIETASVFLCEKCQELADLSSQAITAAASTPATSDRQPAAPLASTATTSYRQSTESVQPAAPSDKVIANTQSVQLISEGQAQTTTLLRDLETRLQTLEADGGRIVKDVQKQVEKWEANKIYILDVLIDYCCCEMLGWDMVY